MTAFARPVRIGAVIGAVVLALSGCTAPTSMSDASATPTPESSYEAVVTIDGAAVTGSGPAPFPGVAFAFPDGDWRSLTLDFECEGGGPFAVAFGDSMDLDQSSLHGRCDGTTTLDWPLRPRMKQTVTVMVGEGVPWKATPHFSTTELMTDPAIEDDCAAFSDVYSAIFNADAGYAQYDDIQEAEWNERVDAASDDLATLADSSTSSLAAPFAELVTAVRSPQRVAGSLRTTIDPMVLTISQACAVNQTPFQINAEYGG